MKTRLNFVAALVAIAALAACGEKPAAPTAAPPTADELRFFGAAKHNDVHP